MGLLSRRSTTSAVLWYTLAWKTKGILSLRYFPNLLPAPKRENNKKSYISIAHTLPDLRIFDSIGFVNLGQNFFRVIYKHLRIIFLYVPQWKKIVPSLSMLSSFGWIISFTLLCNKTICFLTKCYLTRKRKVRDVTNYF